MARQIITGDTIHQALAENQTEIRVESNGIVTDAARELAQNRGVRLVRDDDAAPGPARTASPTLPASASDPASAPVESQVRDAVLRALGGTAPADLDEVIARVMRG